MITEISAEVLQQITTHQAWHYHILPFKTSGQSYSFYTDQDRLNNGLKDELEMLFGKQVHLEGVELVSLQKALSKYYRRQENGQVAKQVMNSNGKTDIHFLENLVKEARQLGSSDIHMEPYEEKCRIRFRIDGKLVERYQLGKEDYPGLINKIKVKSNLDISEKRLPQDGRIFFQEANRQFDIRVSTLPTLHGEKVVMRLLTSDDTDINIDGLGFAKADLAYYLEGVRQPNGMVLISGPTGSGKTTTLYATLQKLNETSRNILTIEDPIEYTLEGINQVQLKEAIGLDFASAMKTFLRQDPDIIMVGEIRDKATASMAIRASLTGHLVLSTLHTNSAWGIVARMVDMGIPGYLLADTLNTAVAQRLVRLLCTDCKKEVPFDTALFPRNYRSPESVVKHFVATGCETCFYTGYRGRKAVYEVIPMDGMLKDRIKNEELNVQDLLKNKQITSLSYNAFQLFIKGETSIEEIYPILSSGA